MSKPKLPTEEKALPDFPYWKGSDRPRGMRYISEKEASEIGMKVIDEVVDETEIKKYLKIQEEYYASIATES